jgi:hypothetical protein
MASLVARNEILLRELKPTPDIGEKSEKKRDVMN